jgi:hypothetical protein
MALRTGVDGGAVYAAMSGIEKDGPPGAAAAPAMVREATARK